MSVIVNELRVGFYLDSVALMRVSGAIAKLDGVEEAALMMGTPSNLQIMQDAGILDDVGRGAAPGDLVLAVRANDEAVGRAALAEGEARLSAPKAAGASDAWQPRSVADAAKLAGDSALALISVPGEFAIAEARAAIRAGMHAMIFSDNVPVAEEAALKQEARELGKFVMGPDCGTAIVAGLPLAFANVVARADVGVIGASGTGIQEITTLIARGGGGISHAIGVGGRDLKDEVGGITTLMAIDALEHDDATSQVVLVSKPPSASVATKVLERVAASAKRWTICFIGADACSLPDNAVQVYSLEAAAQQALGQPVDGCESSNVANTSTSLVGLFAGGTLCAEAQSILVQSGLAVSSNVPIPGASALADRGHRLIDLGDDEYTVGRPHPMIDPSVRDDALRSALASDATGVILVDVVLGYGSSDDPAGHLVSVLQEHAGGADRVIASVTGTDSDPQNRAAQVAVLESAGVEVAGSNAQATRRALARLASAPA